MEKSNPGSPEVSVAYPDDLVEPASFYLLPRYRVTAGSLSGCRLWYNEFTLLPDGPKSLDYKRNLRSRSLI